MARTVYAIDASAAISRIAAILAPLVTNGVIDTISDNVRWPTTGSNKTTKIASMLEAGWNGVVRGNAPRKLEEVISALTLAAYQRFLAKQAEMRHEHVDEVVKNMRTLGLDASDLASRKWRPDLSGEPAGRTTKERPKTSAPPTLQQRVVPTTHHEIVTEVRTLLSATSAITPQQRGKRLEELVHAVLEAERLRPRGPLRNPGEELDRSFTIESLHYLLECKWEDMPVGFPSVRDFIGKVQRKAEGTFGVFLSMSGFVGDINTSAAQGQRLNCVGLTGPQFMDVIEGRTTWCQLVEAARRSASDRSEFQARVRD